MLTSDDKVGGWVKKGQNHDDVILEWSLMKERRENLACFPCALISLYLINLKDHYNSTSYNNTLYPCITLYTVVILQTCRFDFPCFSRRTQRDIKGKTKAAFDLST